MKCRKRKSKNRRNVYAQVPFVVAVYIGENKTKLTKSTWKKSEKKIFQAPSAQTDIKDSGITQVLFIEKTSFVSSSCYLVDVTCSPRWNEIKWNEMDRAVATKYRVSKYLWR